eukprot:scaffold1106_cov608-Prasinococcus_capsulatus_cf.AAC.11
MEAPQFEGLSVELCHNDTVGRITLNRPTKLNAISLPLFQSVPDAVRFLDESCNVRAVVLCAAGKAFCAGIDVAELSKILTSPSECPARAAELLRRHILYLQEMCSSFEKCRCPVIAAIHGACLGAGVDIVTACDIRYCSSDAVFSVKEASKPQEQCTLLYLLVASTIRGHGFCSQPSCNLPKNGNDSVGAAHAPGSAMELALTARTFSAEEAHRLKLVTAVEDSKEDVLARAMRTALELAKKGPLKGVLGLIGFFAMALQSPVAITGTKRVLVHTRDNNVPSGLEFIAVWNSAMLRSSDMTEVRDVVMTLRHRVFAARMEKRQPTYAALINSKL